MASFDAVNYSLRPSKAIQRSLVFSDVRKLQELASIDHSNLLYVGFGSIWFMDFLLAHRVLGASELISVEGNPIGYKRAEFNKPFSCVTVEEGYSGAVLPGLYARQELKGRPWMMWLDYDYDFDEDVRSDVQQALEHLPPNSLFLITFNGVGSKYGQAKRDREVRLRALFGDVVPAQISRAQLDGDPFLDLLKSCAMDYMRSVAFDLGRPGGFIPAFSIAYRDQAPMVTVGGFLPDPGAVQDVVAACTSPQWQSSPSSLIAAPHLTNREAATLQAQLPTGVLNRAIVQQLGFDLEEDQIEAFKRYYLQFPMYAQLVT